MSSLLVLQNKETIVMASDTASSIKKNGVSYRVASDETKIFTIGDFTIFASGNKLIRDIFITMLEENDSLDTIQEKLNKYILPSCGEFSLGVVIAKVERDYSRVVSFSSYNNFIKEESVVNGNETKFFSAGIKTKEIYNSFEKHISTSPLLQAIEKTYKDNSCAEVGGYVDLYQLTFNSSITKQIKIDDYEISSEYKNDNQYISLIWGEYIFGKVISGVNLYIEDESGAWKTQGSRTTIYNADGKEVMWLGLVSDNLRDEFDNIIRQEQGECFGLKSWNDATMVEITDCKGIAISRWKDEAWEKVLWANTDGTLYTKDLVAEGIKIVNNIGDMILDAENGFFDIGFFNKIVADGKLTSIEKLQLATELHKIHADYKALLKHAENYQRSTRDNITDINGAWDSVKGSFPTVESTVDRFSTQPLINAYTTLMNYVSKFIPIVEKGITMDKNLEINHNDPLMEETSEIDDRGYFIQVFRDYNEESQKLKQAIEDAIFYSGINMGSYYNNLIMNDFGFIAVRNDGKYRAYLNATNGLALQKWEKKNGVSRWVNKLYGSIGNSNYTDGTLIAEELVAKKLRIETVNDDVLLDMDSMNIDFSVLESIVYDDVIVSIEKEQLLTQWNSITTQYNEINTQLDKYINEVYSDRDNSYLGLDEARTRLITAKTNLKIAYDALKKTLDIVFLDMTISTFLSTDLLLTRDEFIELFKNVYKTFEIARSALENFLEKSSLQLGRNYNNTIIDAENGVTVYRGNMTHMVQMNATEGFSLSRNDGTASSPSWTKLFKVDTNGGLYAQDITTHNLKIVDGNLGEKIIFDQNNGITINGNKGEQIRLNANEGIAIDVNREKRFWVGTDGCLYAKKLYVVGEEDDSILEDIDGSYISDLTVNRLKTINKGSNVQDIIHIERNFMRFNTYFGNSEKTKLEFTYEGTGESSYPIMIFGAGNGRPYGSGSERAKIYKDSTKFAIEYDAPNGIMSKFYFNETDTDNEGQAVYFESKGGVRFHSDNKFVAKTSTNEYLRIHKNNDARLQFGADSFIALDNNSITIRFNANNYIMISSSGVTVKGTAINLN